MDTLDFHFGTDGQFTGTVADSLLIGRFRPPVGLENLRAAVEQAVSSPHDYPPLHQALVPGDRVVIVLDHGTPEAPAVIAGLWPELQKRDIAPADVVILQPANVSSVSPADPRTLLSEGDREAVTWHVHDPLVADACAYLATTADEERIYLSRELVEADAVILVGGVTFDRLWGYRGLQSALYPGLSTVESLKKAHGQPHEELGPDDSRPLRQKAEEIAWLLGVHYGVGLVAGSGTSASAVFAGQLDSVLREAREALHATWRFTNTDERPELVIAAVDRDASGHGWSQVAAALHAARNLVAKDGRIALVSQLDAPLGDGIQLIRDGRRPSDALRPLRESAPPDLLAATSLAKAVEWANVYLFSGLDADLVEDLFMIPLGGLDELQRLINGERSCALLESAQHVCTEPQRRRKTDAS